MKNMYTIEVKDRGQHVVVLCPTLDSAKEWIYRRLIYYMREDVANNLGLSTMASITQHYAEEFEELRKLREDAVANERFCNYRTTEYTLRQASKKETVGELLNV